MSLALQVFLNILKEETVISHINYGFENGGFKITKVHICKTNMINLLSFKMCDFFSAITWNSQRKAKVKQITFFALKLRRLVTIYISRNCFQINFSKLEEIWHFSALFLFHKRACTHEFSFLAFLPFKCDLQQVLKGPHLQTEDNNRTDPKGRHELLSVSRFRAVFGVY